jgi:uncharacterized protein
MLDRNKVLKLLSEHARELHDLGARWLALFGPFAHDEGSPASDVDLLVDLDVHTLDRYMGLKLRLEDILGRRVDLVPVESLKARVRDRILREAIRAA